MDTTFYACFIAILLLDGVIMNGLTWAVASGRYAHLRAQPPQHPALPGGRKRINTLLNNLLSLSLFGAFFYHFGEGALHGGWPGFATFLGEVLGVLMLYDLMYYFFHRLMHVRSLMRYCHAVHHRVRSPVADESTYLNPLETIGGVGLLLLAVLIFSPISTVSFLVLFAIYSTANIIVHSNLIIPHPAFRLYNFWVEKHNVHHQRARNNYASIFPFWDQAFGTSE
jgi:sterol desaturase/sphingolipid hydroxylase (fatty acid hydroxylase superfamily)